MLTRSAVFLSLFTAVAVAAPQKAQPPASNDLVKRVLQRRDPATRAAALAEITAMLDANDPPKQVDALHALGDIGDVNFDHQAFSTGVHRALASPDAGVRVAALNVLPTYGGQPDDLPTLVALASDPSPDVRTAAPKTYVALNGRIADATFDAMLLKLLSDPDARVQHGALYALAHVPLGEAVEAKIIAMSLDDVVRKDRSLLRDVVQFGLTTRPTIRVAVARRLIDMLLDAPDEPDYPARVCWAFRNSDVEPAAQGEVVAVLVGTYKDTLNPTIHDHCIAAFGKIGTDAALDALADIAADPNEDDRTRQSAARAMQTN